MVFIGFPLYTLVWPSLLSLIGIYAYAKSTIAEEELLIRHFGDEYKEYQKKTKKFFLKIW